MFNIITALALIMFSVPLNGSRVPVQQSNEANGAPIPGLPNVQVGLGLNGNSEIESLQVYHAGQSTQTLNVCTGQPVPRTSTAGSLHTADYNFDGFPDLALQTTALKDGNNHFCVWLFNPQKQQFEASSQLSQLINPVPDPKTHTVISKAFGGCPYCYDKEEYRWSGGQLELVREESLTMNEYTIGEGGCDYVLTVKELRNGEMREVSREPTNAYGGPCSNQPGFNRLDR